MPRSCGQWQCKGQWQSILVSLTLPLPILSLAILVFFEQSSCYRLLCFLCSRYIVDFQETFFFVSPFISAGRDKLFAPSIHNLSPFVCFYPTFPLSVYFSVCLSAYFSFFFLVCDCLSFFSVSVFPSVFLIVLSSKVYLCLKTYNSHFTLS